MSQLPSLDAVLSALEDIRSEPAPGIEAPLVPLSIADKAEASHQATARRRNGSFARGVMVGLAVVAPFWAAVAFMLSRVF